MSDREHVFGQIAQAMADMQADHDRVLAEVVAERGRLRAAIDAALDLTNGDFCPIPDDAKNMRGRAGWHFAMDHIRAALAPVGDPDPHTTSDEETT
jgi:hypothetical protein